VTLEGKSDRSEERKRPSVETVPLSGVKRTRHSKHYELMQEVLKQLEKLANRSAIKIELIDVAAKTMRSAVFRAASARNIEITSFSDQDHLYILKKSPHSKPPGSR